MGNTSGGMNRVLSFSFKLAVYSFAFIGLVFLLFRIFPKYDATLEFRNESGMAIESLSIELRNNSCGVQGLEDGGQLLCWFGRVGDAGYNTRILLSDGRQFEYLDYGYVGGGVETNSLMILDESGNLDYTYK